MDLEAAQVAEDAYKAHQNACELGCRKGGTAQTEGRGWPRTWRCEEGRELWRLWQAHRPSPLTGNRTLPNGEQSKAGVVEKVHTVGYIDIVELRHDKSEDRAGVREWKQHGTTRIDLFVNGVQEWIDVGSIEMGLLLGIAAKRGELGAGSAYYAGRVLGFTDEEMGEKP